jgi:hypothetical protein
VEVIVQHQTSGERLVTRGPLMVRVLDGGPSTIEDVDLACELLEQMLEQYPAIALVVIVEHGTPVPPIAVFRYTTERFGAYGDRVLLGSCLLGLGFWAKTALSSMTTALRFTGTLTVLTETNLESLARQLSFELVGLDPADLVAFFEQQRALLRAHRDSLA